MWFEKLTGFVEENGDQVRNNLVMVGSTMKSLVNNQTFECGTLEIPTLKDLKAITKPLSHYSDQIKIEEVVGNVQHLHTDIKNAGAVFQAASQFNLLEMLGPNVTPEAGIDGYEDDHTQGPVCAIACGAGTIFRNYFVKINGQLGQTENKQIDCLDEIGIALGNKNEVLWKMSNGYALANEAGLIHIELFLKQLSVENYIDIKNKLKVGIQSNTEVTLSDTKQLVTQVYCSALPVAYSNINDSFWETFARLVLEATYEATFYAALKNYEQTGNNKLFLTLVGGGAFGNRTEWILNAIRKAMIQFSQVPLDVKIVSYGNSNQDVRQFVNSF